MGLHLPLLVAYSALLIGLGLWIGRRVRSSEGFFVAGRGLGPGLLFATLLAANIGAGSTVGAAALGYANGLAASWWVGAAALGSFVQAIWVGPRLRREAADRGLKTVGDYLEWRYHSSVRALVSSLLWLGTLAILAGQLIALSTLLTGVTGAPKWVGCVLGGVVITTYFSAGGLLSSAWVSVVQVAVKMLGFAIALPVALAHAGGWSDVVRRAPADPAFLSLWSNGPSGWTYLFLLGPAFVISPGLLQKIFGARDDRAVRFGVGANALALLVFAAVPPTLGIIARVLHPDLGNSQLALPSLLVYDVPVAVGALGLAALFSAEVSAAEAGLFMLATSLSQDLYRRFVRPKATDREVLLVARATALAGGSLGIALALLAQTIVGTLSFFYSVLGVSLFVPILAGLYVPRFRTAGALVSIVVGVTVMLALQLSTDGAGVGWVTPSIGGLMAAIVAAMLGTMATARTAPAARQEGA